MMTVFNHCDFIRYPKEEDPFLDYPCLRLQEVKTGGMRTVAVLSAYGGVALVWWYEGKCLQVVHFKLEEVDE